MIGNKTKFHWQIHIFHHEQFIRTNSANWRSNWNWQSTRRCEEFYITHFQFINPKMRTAYGSQLCLASFQVTSHSRNQSRQTESQRHFPKCLYGEKIELGRFASVWIRTILRQNKINVFSRKGRTFLPRRLLRRGKYLIDFRKWQTRSGRVDSKAACNCQSNSQKIEIFTTEQIRQENLR